MADISIPTGLTILVIAAANAFLGWLTFSQSRSFRFLRSRDYLETLFASITLGVCINGWVAFVLAEFGRFSITNLMALWVVMVFVLGSSAWRRRGNLRESPDDPELDIPGEDLPWMSPATGRGLLPTWLQYPFLGIWLVAAFWLFFRPHEFIIGGADAGVYVNLGAEIAHNGSILIQDELLAEIDPSLYPAFLRPINNPVAPYYYLPAFFVIGEVAGRLTPQFYPLHPVWQAVAYSLGGTQAELAITGLWALLGSLAIYLVVRQIAGWEAAALALAGLSVNAMQVWFARYPTTEALSQYFLWAGLWSLGRWLGTRKPGPAMPLLAGLTLGSFFLVRIDTLFIAPILALVGLWMWIRGQWHLHARLFFIPLILLASHSVVHAVWQSSPYFYELFHLAVRIFKSPWILWISTLAGIVLLLWSRSHFLKNGDVIARFQKPAAVGAIIMLILLAGYSWFFRPYGAAPVGWDDPYSTLTVPILDHENLIRLGWYLSPIGIWLGVAGICLMLWRLNRSTAIMLGVTLFYTLFFIWRIRANPHQIYAMRRYVPAVMPLFIIGGAVIMGEWLRRKRLWLTVMTVVLAAGWLAGLGWLARGFVTQVDYRGLSAGVAQINSQLSPRAVLLFNDQAPIGQGDLWGTTMRFLYGRPVFSLRDPHMIEKADLDEIILNWQDQGFDVYWIAVKDGQVSLHPSGSMAFVRSYELEAKRMEVSYERRPTALSDIRFAGDIYVLSRP